MALFGIKPKSKENAIPPAVVEKKPNEEMKNADDATVDVNGTPVPLYELVEAYKMKMGAGNTPPTLTPEDEVQVEGFGAVKVADLIASYSGAAEPAEPAEPAMENADESGRAVEPKDAAKINNAAPIRPKVNQALKNAALAADGAKPTIIETEGQRIKRGNANWTIPVKNGGAN
jgi:hypothetical protein